jgi:Pretoxin HINT domain
VVSTAVILSKPGVLQGIVATGLEDIKKGFKDNVINGTAYTRIKYATEVVLTVGSLFIGAGEVKAASGLNKAGSISKLAKLEKATGLLDDAARAADKADDVLRYTSKVENVLEDGGALLGKSTKGGNKFGKIIGGADNVAEKKLATAACFVAGTVVLTNVGYESIEKIKAGDTVYSQNAETGEKGYKKVVRTFQKEVDTLVYLKIGSKEIVTTENQPFYVEGKGFVHAGELKAGEKVVTASGKTLTVDKVNIEKTKEKTKVYNFEVEDWHTYFVSTEEILVHNDCRAPLSEGAAEAKYQVGAYEDIRGVEGLDAHHAGQKAAMKNLVEGYDPMTGPAINVPKIGHTIKGPNGIVSRSTKGITDARQLLARDLFELKRVYPDIPNSKFRELIELNKKLYPEMRK